MSSIDLSACCIISDISVSAVAHNCPELYFVDLSHCKEITDIGVSSVASNCFRLNHIDLAYCQKITDVGVSAQCTKADIPANVTLLHSARSIFFRKEQL